MNREILQKRIDEYNNEVRQEFQAQIGNKRVVPWLLKSFETTYDEDSILSLKEILDRQLIRYKTIMSFIEGYILGSNANLNIQLENIEKQFIPNISDEMTFVLDECEFQRELYPDNLISILHIT